MARAIQAIFTLIVLLGFPLAASATLGVQGHYAGFQGEWALGPAYKFNSRHAVDMTMGTFLIDQEQHHQLNAGYVYSPWRINLNARNSWVPISQGLYVLYALDHSRYFAKSPGRYPSDNYYEQTALRLGLQIGTAVRMVRRRLELSAYTMILDTAAVAYFNNDHETVGHYLGSGIGVKFYF